MIETTLIDNIIVGRIDPHIYAFRTNTVPDYLKVGDTYRPVNVRLNEWRQVFPNLEHLEEWKWVAKTQNEKYFRDFAVHYYLEEIKHLHRLQPNDIQGLPYYSREFFQNAKPEDIDEAILDIERYAKLIGGPYQFYSDERLPVIEHYERSESYPPRPNQEKTIASFNEARRNGRHNLLMYAVMRFGKSFTSMCCATEMDAKTVLIVSAKADVKTEWKRTVESHVRFSDYTFIDSLTLINDPKSISNLIKQGKRAAIFMTLQDLMGDAIKDKHKDIFRNQIDLLIIDETHFGARAEEYGKVLREAELTTTQIKKELSKADETLDDLEEGLSIVKKLKVDTTLHLSGTPYRILMGSEFKPEDIIAFYQFTDIIDDKDEWDRQHLTNEDVKEWDNPYYGFPQMVRFAFNPNKSSCQLLEQLKEQGKTASLTELFRPSSISKDTTSAKKHLYFAHEKEVLDLLLVIDGSQEDENLLGFLDYKKLKEGSMCRHIVCVLPFCASCDAFEKLLKSNKNKFINLSQYEIVNISGVDDNQFGSTEQIKRHISELEARNKKSITLTVNRMLTGSTVKEWDTMLFLKDVSSPQEYDQAIFRLQNQYVKTFIDDSGDHIVYNMKPQTLLVDFDPNRMFVMQEQKSKIYNVNTEERGNEELEERIKKELKISPIIVMNKGKLVEAVPTDVMDAVRKYSASRTVMDEARDIPTDFVLLQDPQIQRLIEGLEPINTQKGFNIKPVEGDGDDFDFENDEDNSIPSDNSDKHWPDSTDNTQPKEKKDDADKRLATYFAQILFFSLLTDDEVDSLQDIIQVIRHDVGNQRIARNVGLKASSLSYLFRGINPFILQDLDYKIKNINELARDTSLEPLVRVEMALKKFGRLSISEIVTPSNVADAVVALLPDDGISENTRFLDIASKQAEFACAIYRRFGDQVRDNIISLPTSSLTYEFTRKVYSLLELPLNNIISSFNTYDLIGKNKEICKNIIKNMKFNAIVGNPPYQLTGASGGNNDAPIYQVFSDLANKLCIDFASIILPSRWFAAGRENLLGEYRNFMLNCGNIRKLVTYSNGRDVFPNVEIKGGICYYLYDEKYQGKCNYSLISENNSESAMVDLSKFDILIREPKLAKIVTKVLEIAETSSLNFVDSIISSDTPFGIPSNPRTSSKTPFKVYAEKGTDHNVLLFHIENQKRKVEYASYADLRKNIEDVNKPKVFVPGSGGSGKDPYVLGKPELAPANSVCSQSYLYAAFDTKEQAENFYKYLHTKFLRILVSIMKITQSAPKRVYRFVPMQDYTNNSDIDWSKSIPEIDKMLYKKYALDTIDGAIDFIEKSLKPI